MSLYITRILLSMGLTGAAIVALILLAIAGHKLVKELVNYLKEQGLYDFVFEQVKGAEQIFRENKGPEKLDYVLNRVMAYINDKGINLNRNQIRGIIEGAVKKLNDQEEHNVI